MPLIVALLIGLFGLAGYPVGIVLLRIPRRLDNDACESCGYSLLGVEASEVCPECGHPKGAELDTNQSHLRAATRTALATCLALAIVGGSLVALHNEVRNNLVAPVITSVFSLGILILLTHLSSLRLRSGPAWLMTLPVAFCAGAFACTWYDDLILSHDDLTGISLCAAPVFTVPLTGWVFVVCAAIAMWWNRRRL